VPGTAFVRVLIEALVENRDERFSIGDFSQAQDGVVRDNWQVAWAERFLLWTVTLSS